MSMLVCSEVKSYRVSVREVNSPSPLADDRLGYGDGDAEFIAEEPYNKTS
jgi:hypothetical protein